MQQNRTGTQSKATPDRSAGNASLASTKRPSIPLSWYVAKGDDMV